ncbi:MAG: metallophosphoesterase family protein [Nanoarchaeota archaeon]
MIYFTGDTHFGHSNIIKYCNRPFQSIEDMDETLIYNWNQKVWDDDIIFHLGDFCFGKNNSDFSKYFQQLNGKIILIKGNHDSLAKKNKSYFHEYYDSYKEIEVSDRRITLCHYAMRVWNKSHRGAWHLYGHSHGSLPDDPNALSLDVGVDCWNYAPVSIDQIAEKMQTKNWKTVDHHEDRV